MKSILCQIYLKFFNFFNSLVGKTSSSLNHIYLSYLLGKTSTKSNFYHEHPNFLFMLPRVLPKILIKSYLLSFYHQKSYFANTLVSVKNGHFSLHSCKTIKLLYNKHYIKWHECVFLSFQGQCVWSYDSYRTRSALLRTFFRPLSTNFHWLPSTFSHRTSWPCARSQAGLYEIHLTWVFYPAGNPLRWPYNIDLQISFPLLDSRRPLEFLSLNWTLVYP